MLLQLELMSLKSGGAPDPRTFKPTSVLVNTAMPDLPGPCFMPASVQENTNTVLRVEAMEEEINTKT